MHHQARVVWEALELRTPAMLRAFDPLSEEQIRWRPPGGANSVAWLIWHIAEVEDNWVRDRVLHLPRRFPFGASVHATSAEAFPAKPALLDYFHEVRALSRKRLADSSPEDFDAPVDDESFGRIDVRRVWAGVATSGAWHGGQLVMLANRLIPR